MTKNKNLCPCCSGNEFKNCCEPCLKNKQIPVTPEQLMRSRYTAYYLGDLAYIKVTMQGKALENFNLRESIANNKKCKWLSLKVISSSQNENSGTVEFIAEYSSYGKIHYLREKSEFQFVDGCWFYVGGVSF